MLETPSIRRYSSMLSHPLRRVPAWAVTIRPVRTISRKGLVPHTGWIESGVIWATGSLDSSMEREASTSRSVESVIDCLVPMRNVLGRLADSLTSAGIYRDVHRH